MNALEFKDVTIIYNEKQVNKELCKKKSKQQTLLVLIATLIAFLTIVGLAMILDNSVLSENKPSMMIVSIIALSSVIIALNMVVYTINKIIYGKQIKAFEFMDYAFTIKSISADWFDNKVLLKISTPSNTSYINLDMFIDSIGNEKVIADNSDKQHPIHITIDTTDNTKTEIFIENTEETK